ncbi:MAG TPA: acyl-CoA dehydrogenase family protein [Thermoflexales bacterium]|nr:acyl-CoA dehydrogenase family protein [Thermoflexales bacterium]
MSTLFTPEHEMLRQTAREFVQAELDPHAEHWEKQGIWPAHTVLKKMGDLGLLGLSYAEEYGGGGADYSFNAVLLEELGRAVPMGATLGICVHTDMATPALAKHGSAELKQRWLVPAIKGEVVSAIAVSEPDAGSDVAAIRTTAVSAGDDYVINGSKMWITNGTQADYLCLLARTSEHGGHHGMSLIVVPTDTPGFSVSRTLEKLGLRDSDTAILSFDNVRVPKSNRIGREGMGFTYQMQQFQRERLAMSLLSLGSMTRAIDLTKTYLKERRAFGKPLIQNQAIYFALAELTAEVEALRYLCYECVRQYAAGQDMTRLASMAKLKSGLLSRKVADTCLQFHGGMGYVEEYPIARYFRDVRLWAIGGGADEVMMEVIAKFEGMGPKAR